MSASNWLNTKTAFKILKGKSLNLHLSKDALKYNISVPELVNLLILNLMISFRSNSSSDLWFIIGEAKL